MAYDPFDGYWLLSFELADNPGHEYEEYVADLAEARAHLRQYPAHMIASAELYNGEGELICDKQVLV